MTKKIKLVFGVHNHQPIGNFDDIIEDAYQHCYEPFLSLLEKHPKVAVTLHYSGTLLDWFFAKHPEMIDRIRLLLNRKNVELLSSAYYEPVLTAIPEEDRIGQIQKMNNLLHTAFGYEAKGMWLTERVWEPHLPQSIELANIKYTALDEVNFRSSGVAQFPVKAYYNTEENGHTVGVFSISRTLRDLAPYSEPQKIIDYLKDQVSDNNQHLLVMLDDGEKFGIYPNTYQKVYGDNWLEKFFTLLEANEDWIQTTTLKAYYEQFTPQGLLYFPSSSYFEMGEWALQADIQKDFTDFVQEIESSGHLEERRHFLRGGYWRNFMSKYLETNWMQKRMQQITRKFRLLEMTSPRKESLRKIRNALWKGMCNNAYWYGVYGGLYLPHLRRAVWQNLIFAEDKIDSRLFNLEDDYYVREESDINRNGLTDIKITTRNYDAIFSVNTAGALAEFDFRPSLVNVCDMIRRIPEKYHDLIRCQKDSGTQKYLHDKGQQIPFAKDDLYYDSVPRYSLLEKYFDVEISVDKVYKNQYKDASDFVNQAVDYLRDRDDRTVSFSREGWINWQRMRLRKDIVMLENGFEAHYSLTNVGMGGNRFAFGPEFNFALAAGLDNEKYLTLNGQPDTYSVKAMLDEKQLNQFSIRNLHDQYQLTLRFDQPVRLISYPVETIILAQKGYEKIYQGSAFLPLWQVESKPGQTYHFKLSFEIIRIAGANES
jgi:4-alpha-glucanotransferase